LNAEIITTGTEILLGEIVDTNAVWIARQLRESGINLYYKTTVGDNEERLRTVIELALSRSDVMIITGGLGPTVDDISRPAIAAATGRPLELREDALRTLEARFARFGVTMTDNNRQQAYIPQGATLIENPAGTAPGILVEDERGVVIALPGVPREMKAMMRATVLPWLRARNGNQGVIRRRVLRTVGIGESAIDSRIADLMQGGNPSVGLAAHAGQVDIRITASAQGEDEVEALLDGMEARLREVIGPYIYSSTPRESFAAVVAQQLRDAQATVALLETNTRGNIAKALATALADDRDIVTGFIPADLPPDQRAELEQAAADGYAEELALVSATRAAELGRTTYGIAVLGSDGEDEGVFAAQPGETYLAIVGADLSASHRLPWGGRDMYTQLLTGNQALILLWRALQP